MRLAIVLLALVVILLLVVRPVHAETVAVTAFSDMPSDSVIKSFSPNPLPWRSSPSARPDSLAGG
jgi:hypothetical protein